MIEYSATIYYGGMDMDKNDFRKDIKRDLKIMKRNKVISALIYVALGVVLLAWPAETLTSVSKIIALILAFGGAVAVVMYFVNGTKGLFSYAGLTGGVIVAVIGMWLFYHSDFLVSLIPTIVGFMLIISGLVNLSEAFQIKKEHGEGVLMSVILAAITILLGVIIFAFQMQFASLVTRLMGIALVYDGVSDLLIISKITGVVKTVELAAEQARKDAAAVDVTDTAKETTATASDDDDDDDDDDMPKKRFPFGWGKKDKAADATVTRPTASVVDPAPACAATEDDFEPEESEAPAPAAETAEPAPDPVPEVYENVETPASEAEDVITPDPEAPTSDNTDADDSAL